MQHNVQDPRLAAGRGEEYRIEAVRQREAEELELQLLDDGDFRLPLKRYIEENVDLDETECASIDTAIPPSNVGYRLLQKLGWRPGGGLGREQQGICEPVRLDANDTGTRIGVGRGQVDKQYTAAENVERRAMEVEIQADEGEERKQKREVSAVSSAGTAGGGSAGGAGSGRCSSSGSSISIREGRGSSAAAAARAA